MPTPRLMIGDYGDGTIGLKASKPGFDVTVRADDDNFDRRTFNSEWAGLLKAYQLGLVSAVPALGIDVMYAQNLGYFPFVEVRPFMLSNPPNFPGSMFCDDISLNFNYDNGNDHYKHWTTAVQTKIYKDRLTLGTRIGLPVSAGLGATNPPWTAQPAVYAVFRRPVA